MIMTQVFDGNLSSVGPPLEMDKEVILILTIAYNKSLQSLAKAGDHVTPHPLKLS